jgi:hypothetical protein
LDLLENEFRKKYNNGLIYIMADRVGTYLSDENCRRRCVNQTPPMSKTYGLFITPGTSISRMPQRPQNPAKLMLQLARAKGVSYAGLKSQYLDALSIVPRQDTMVLGGLNRGMPTPAPSMTPVALASSITAGAIPVAAVPRSGGGSSSGQTSTPLKFRRLFDTMAHQPTKSEPIRSRPIIVPKVPDAPLQIKDMPGLQRFQQARVGDSNSERLSELATRQSKLEASIQSHLARQKQPASSSSSDEEPEKYPLPERLLARMDEGEVKKAFGRNITGKQLEAYAYHQEHDYVDPRPSDPTPRPSKI